MHHQCGTAVLLHVLLLCPSHQHEAETFSHVFFVILALFADLCRPSPPLPVWANFWESYSSSNTRSIKDNFIALTHRFQVSVFTEVIKASFSNCINLQLFGGLHTSVSSCGSLSTAKEQTDTINPPWVTCYSDNNCKRFVFLNKTINVLPDGEIKYVTTHHKLKGI